MDKSALYGFSLPKGTWMVSMKIENDELWSKIKSGELKGLSIEGYFIDKIQKMKKQDFTTEEVRTALKELLSVQKVELALIDDIDKLLDNASRTVKSADKKLISANQELLSATAPVQSARQKIADALKMAKELGADEAIRLFNVRMEEVKYYDDIISSAHSKIDQGINELP